MRKILSLLFVCLLAVSLSAQQRGGNIYGTCTDEEGIPLPGVNVTLTGPVTGTMSRVTSAEGVFRFLSLSPSSEYQLKAELAGFKTRIETGVIVNVGKNTNLVLIMEVGALEEEITVVATTPTVTPKRTEITHTVDREMLQALPSARDPWVVIQMVPSVLVDRENIGGSESGQQSSFVAKGETTDKWVMDGINITDMNAGASPTYYDYDIFEEISVTTGMPDVEHKDRAIVVSMVTRRGQNKFGFGGRFFLTDESWQPNPRSNYNMDTGLYTGDPTPFDQVKDVLDPNRLDPNKGYNHIVQINDFGFNMGGPLVKDKVWWWMSYGVQQIKTHVITGTRDDTYLNNYAGKLNFQLIPDNRAEIFLHLGDKKKYGRSSTTSNPPGANQHGKYHWGSPILKIQDEHMFGDDLFLSARYGFTDAGFGMWPATDEDLTAHRWWDDTNRIYKNPWGEFSYSYYFFCGRPHQNGVVQAVYYNDNLFGASHEIKIGAELDNNQRTYVGGNAGNFSITYNYDNDVADTDLDGNINILPYAGPGTDSWYFIGIGNNDLAWTDSDERYGFYLQDIVTAGRVTFNLQVRFDHMQGFREPLTTLSLYTTDVEGDWHDYYYEITQERFSARAITGITTALPQKTRGAVTQPNEFLFWSISPRLGITFDVFGDGKTIAKAAFAMYPGGPQSEGYWQPYGMYPWMDFLWRDQDGNMQADTTELYWYNAADAERPVYRAFTDAGALSAEAEANHAREQGYMWGGFNWDNPTGITASNTFVDPDIKHFWDYDVMFSLEREIFPDFGVGVDITYRWNGNYAWSLSYYPTHDNDGVATAFNDPAWPIPNHIRSKDDYAIAFYVPDFLTPDTGWEIDMHGAQISTGEAAGRPVYLLKDANVAAYTQYSWRTNRPDRNNKYWGADFRWNKRFSNRWMLSGSFTMQMQKSYYGQGYLNPSNLWAFDKQMYTNSMGGGSGKTSVPMFSRWMFKLQGMYQLPWGFDISASLTGREGMLVDDYFYIADRRVVTATAFSTRDYGEYMENTTNENERRLNSVWLVNTKIQKMIKVGDIGRVWLSMDIFNTFNNQGMNRIRNEYYGSYYMRYTPARFYGNTRFAEPNESLNPLILRFGLRFQF
jgi:hypothetical protein